MISDKEVIPTPYKISLQTTQLNKDEVGRIIRAHDPEAKIAYRGVRLWEGAGGIPEAVAAATPIVVDVIANTLTIINYLSTYATSLAKKAAPAQQTFIRIEIDPKRGKILDLASTNLDAVKTA